MKKNNPNNDLTFEKVWLLFQETDKKFQETDKKFQETDKKLRQLEDLFVGQWGKLTEALVEGQLVKMLRERNIDVTGVSSRSYKMFEGKEYEFDLIAENGNELVVVEVKTSLYQKHIDHFIDKLKKFKEIFPQYKNYKIYGAVAFIKSGTEVRRYAYKKGLFVIRAVGESAKIINDEKFVPKEF